MSARLERLRHAFLLWVEGSLFFSAILWVIECVQVFFAGSFLVRLFSADFDEERLGRSFFVRFFEHGFNRFPKILSPPIVEDDAAENGWLHGSVILNSLFNAMETPLPRKKLFSGFGTWLKWFFAAFPAWGMVAVAVSAPFLPTILLAAMLVVVFTAALFRYEFRLDLTAVMLILFVIVSLFSGFTSITPDTSVPVALLSSAFILAYLLVRVCFCGRRAVDFLMAVMVISAAFTGLVALYQFATGVVAELAWVGEDAAMTTRVFATFGNPNVYGTYLLLMIPLAGGLFLYAKKTIFKLAALGICGLLVLSLLLTFSRGCYVALAVAVVVFMLLLEKRLIVLCVAGVIALPFVLPPAVLARVLSVVDFTDTSTLYRFSIWQSTVRLLGDFWMTGIGQGMGAYQRAMPMYAFAGVSAAHTHNIFMQIFVETGLVGLIVFVGVLACFFRGQFVFMRRDDAEKRRQVLAAAITAGVVGFLVQGMFDYPFHNYSVMLVFFLFLGIGGAVVTLKS